MAGTIRGGRLPLIEEYQGRCARRQPDIAVGERTCNQGYARQACSHFPEELTNRANRYSLLNAADGALTVLCIREEEYAPAESRLLHFSVAQNSLLEEDLDACTFAQAVAFCRSYLRMHAPSCR